ncbi:helix-turn-helix domain-containing protein [Sphingomonas sp. XXL09]|uniref:helix-turn-helix domain-containing protein n=1 Tax=Sphingomonas sp. XXL09 TaxID=3457787 RepID=UPI00406BDC05
MKLIGLSQSELARRVGVSQQNIGHLLSGNAQGSKRLHLIARELRTTPAYLTGEIDDADEGAPPPVPPRPPRIMLEVVLPSEDLLAAMFEGVLLGIDRELPLDAQARLLARSLPIAMSQIQCARPVPAPPVPEIRADAREAVEALATHGHGGQP